MISWHPFPSLPRPVMLQEKTFLTTETQAYARTH